MLQAVQVWLSSVFWMLPCEVVSLSTLGGGAQIFAELRPVVNLRDAAGAIIELPSLVDVPVQWPSGGGYSFTFPLDVGDTGLCFFASASIATWTATGAVRSDPEGRRQGHPTDAVFIPGLRPLTSPPANAVRSVADDTLRLGVDADDSTPGRIIIDQAGKVVVDSPDIRAGSDAATDFVSLSSLVAFNLNGIKAALDIIATAAGTSHPYTVSSTAATKLKAE
jgi:hypothetical protein